MGWVGVGKEKLASISKLWLRMKSLSKGTKKREAPKIHLTKQQINLFTRISMMAVSLSSLFSDLSLFMYGEILMPGSK